MEKVKEDVTSQMNDEKRNLSEMSGRSTRLVERKIMYGGSCALAFVGMCFDSVANVVKNTYLFRWVACIVVVLVVGRFLLRSALRHKSISVNLKKTLQEFSQVGLCMASAVVGGLAALGMFRVFSYIDNETTDYLYSENVIDNYGVLKAAGKQSNTLIPGWYRFTYKGTHSIDDKHIHRYDSNQIRPFGILPWRYRTLHSVELVDGANHTLPIDCAMTPSTRIVYKYRQDGLDVETWEYSILDGAFDNGFHLELVDKWYDSGNRINVECKAVDGENRRRFAPSSSTSLGGAWPLQDIVLPHSKFSSYKVVRDENGRRTSISTAVPDHDGVKRIDLEYADNDEHNLPYVRREIYNTINVDGIQQIEKDYNGTSIDLRLTGNSRINITIDSIYRNENLWTNMVVSYNINNGIMNTNFVVRQTRSFDNLGRVVKDKISRRMENGEECIAETRYSWTVINEANVVSDIEYRDGEGNLIERPSSLLSEVFWTSGTNMPMASRIRYVIGKRYADAILFDTTGTNVSARIRFYGENNGRERIEWRSHDGENVVPISIWKDSVVVAWESKCCQDNIDVVRQNAAERLQCREICWLNVSGDLAQCPAGWAARRVYTNPDYNDDVEDIGFSGQVRRIEYLGADGKPCRMSVVVPIQEYDHDKSGRITEVRNLDADGKPVVFPVTPNGGLLVAACIKNEYDNIGRIIRQLFFDENGMACEQAELAFTYVGESRNPVKVEMVGRSGARVDVTMGENPVCDGVSPKLNMPVRMGSVGHETKEPD